MRRADRINPKGTFATRDEAAASLVDAGDTALVQRGVPRLLLMRCPCGCGDILVINVDRRSGPAWRIYLRKKALTLYPSYWRDSACNSHFVVWDNRVYWCDSEEEGLWDEPNDIENRVLEALPNQYVHYMDLAENLKEIPWEVLQACHSLVRKGLAEMNLPRRKGEFRRSTSYK